MKRVQLVGVDVHSSLCRRRCLCGLEDAERDYEERRASDHLASGADRLGAA